MKKFISAVLLSAVIIGVIPSAFADMQSGGNYGFTSTSGYSYTIPCTMEELSMLCAMANKDIGEGKYGSDGRSFMVFMEYNGYYWFGKLYNYNHEFTGRYLGNSNGGAYAAYPNEQITLDLQTDYLRSINSHLSTISTNITNYFSNWDSRLLNINNTVSKIVGHTAYLPTISSTLLTANNNIVAVKNAIEGLSFDNTGVESGLTQLHNDLVGINGKMFEPHYNLSARTPGDSVAYIPRMSAEMMVAYYNIFMFGEIIQPVAYPADQPATFYHAYIDDNGFIKAHCWIASIGQYADFYMITRFDAYCVTDNSSSGTFDDTRIVNSIDRIYDWLDNADLATNTTITNVVQNSTNEVINALPNFDRVRGLFTAAFGDMDNSHSLTDWGMALSYFGNLWSDQ